MKKRKYMKDKNKHNYSYGKPYYLKNKKNEKKSNKGSRDFSFKNIFKKLNPKEKLSFDKEDVETVVQQTGCSEEEAKEALKREDDLAKAIMSLS